MDLSHFSTLRDVNKYIAGMDARIAELAADGERLRERVAQLESSADPLTVMLRNRAHIAEARVAELEAEVSALRQNSSKPYSDPPKSPERPVTVAEFEAALREYNLLSLGFTIGQIDDTEREGK